MVKQRVQSAIGGWGRQKCELIVGRCGSSEVDHIETGEIMSWYTFQEDDLFYPLFTSFHVIFLGWPCASTGLQKNAHPCVNTMKWYEVLLLFVELLWFRQYSVANMFFFGTAVFKVNYFDFQNLHDLFQLLINPWLGHGNDVFQEGFWFQFSPGFLWMLRKRHLRCSCTCGGIIPKNVEYFTSNCMLLSRLWATYHRSRNSFQTACSIGLTITRTCPAFWAALL